MTVFIFFRVFGGSTMVFVLENRNLLYNCCKYLSFWGLQLWLFEHRNLFLIAKFAKIVELSPPWVLLKSLEYRKIMGLSLPKILFQSEVEHTHLVHHFLSFFFKDVNMAQVCGTYHVRFCSIRVLLIMSIVIRYGYLFLRCGHISDDKHICF